MSLEDCLPPELRGPATVITRIGAGMSRAAVYRVEAGNEVLVLKIGGDTEPVAAWRCTLEIQRLASAAGLAPRIVHVDESRRATVTAFVVDRSFAMFYLSLQTQDAAIRQLAETIRRVHALPLPAHATTSDRRELLITLSREVEAAVPRFARDAIDRGIAERPPTDGRAAVLSHNDLNPGNIVYDGTSIMLVDWQTAGPMHPHFDLATIAMFLRLTDAACVELLSAYEGAQIDAVPAMFAYWRRLAATVCGAHIVQLALQMKHPCATSADTLDSALSLGDVYQQVRSEALNLASADGQWAFGLALLKQSLTL